MANKTATSKERKRLLLDYLHSQGQVDAETYRLTNVVSLTDWGDEVSVVIQRGNNRKTRKRYVVRLLDLTAYVNNQLP